jgi:Domain of unknown function (DUF4332)
MEAGVLIVAAAGLLAASTAGAVRGVEPFATWYYPLAWYPTLLAADALVRLRTGCWALLGRPGSAAAMLAWSVPFWLFFELLNFRLSNWYYVFLPADMVSRWAGIVLSFATVLPAIVLARTVLASFGVAGRVRWTPVPVRASLPLVLQGVGVLFFALAMAWPRACFPLVWGGVTLLVDPWVYRRDPDRSLLGALERGRPALILQLLAGGLAIGLLWEAYNFVARGHWIYTVPGLENVKLFEMPVPGFLGFPMLALDGWAAWNALVLARLASSERALGPSRGSRTRTPSRPLRLRTLAVLTPLTLLACGLVLKGMERWTISSLAPRLDEVVGPAATRLTRAGFDVFSLARSDADTAARAAGVPDSVAEMWVKRARLTTLRGIGAGNARRLEQAGVSSVSTLAHTDPAALDDALDADGGPDVPPARVRVWVRGARSER